MASKSSIEKDRSIIRELIRDARQTNVALAAKVGLSEGAVRRRVERLLAEGQFHFAVIPSPSFMGRPVHTMFEIQSAPGATEQLIEQLVAMPEISYVYHVTGQFDIVAVGYFTSSNEMRTFWTERLGNLDGLMESRTLMVLRVAKRAHEWAREMATDEADPD
ncbi:Lrp/AsnC family transcriptional regulator, regulator for asnA, asnC and gidA [Sinosporangium album]|uniref:Lrp/AsnC family transcriptional regulator, regulator for asnA, asnC and gidA n=2 Tax=Sinosporangium album TaxID=504805 RepID=A0A1G7QPQ4_9ACTN|nr:Lrp/AsnC family transcriptional regulator, regulator for asnA, asnC and gidA [Sinosporangium album]